MRYWNYFWVCRILLINFIHSRNSRRCQALKIYFFSQEISRKYSKRKFDFIVLKFQGKLEEGFDSHVKWMLHWEEKPKKSFSYFYRINSGCVAWVSVRSMSHGCLCVCRENVFLTQKKNSKSSPRGIRIRSSCRNSCCYDLREKRKYL